jgi:hypothetical protein
MTPDPRLSTVPATQLPATSWTGPANARAMLCMKVHPAFRRLQFNCVNEPWLVQSENSRKQLRVLQGLPPERTMAGKLLTKNRKDRKNREAKINVAPVRVRARGGGELQRWCGQTKFVCVPGPWRGAGRRRRKAWRIVCASSCICVKESHEVPKEVPRQFYRLHRQYIEKGC